MIFYWMHFLARFEKPSRYINRELNSIHDPAPLRAAPLAVALCFPDTYEVGMSHLGLKVLYRIINLLPYARAERVFHPWGDLENYLREKGEPLSSLESNTPLREFDIIGMSLQYELSYTSVLNMLELGGIPVRREERERPFPLVIAGGPSAVNPAPLSPFIDAFLIGDGEEAVPEIMKSLWRFKKEGDGKKESLLRELKKIEGVYVPALHKKGESARRRSIRSLEDAPYPESPVLPYAPLVHDRINIEVSRGCTMGCRFCQAGMIYRPLRERSPERVLALAEKALKATGYEEVAFTSLSAGDYSSLLPLIREFNRRFSKNMVSVSLPSLRVKAINEEVLREIKSVRKTGFTIAPEAATERLRCAINKDFSGEDYEKALYVLFKEGWLNLKLYFMIGLPTETWEDIEAIPRMALSALQAARKFTGRHVNIKVSASSFVPKPHTPFQWEPQNDMGELSEKKSFLRKALSRKGITFKSHDERMSLLEAAFARGDENISELLLKAHSLGARLDGWGDLFNFEIWQRAMEETGIDAAGYAKKSYEIEDELPWDNVDTGVEKSYLIREYRAAASVKKTPDCRLLCAGCGLKCEEKGAEKGIIEEKTPPLIPPLPKGGKGGLESFRYRVEFSKDSPLELLSHRELVTAITRAARRAELPLEFSKGFHPAPRLAFGPPLGVGVKGQAEYFDIGLSAYFHPEGLLEVLNASLPPGIKINRAVPLLPQAESLQSFISRYIYEIIGIDPARGREFLDKKEVLAIRDSGRVNIRDTVVSIEGTGPESARVVLEDRERVKVRLEETVSLVFGKDLREADITRIGMLGLKGGMWVLPVPRTG